MFDLRVKYCLELVELYQNDTPTQLLVCVLATVSSVLFEKLIVAELIK
jgi:hypothetical protein